MSTLYQKFELPNSIEITEDTENKNRASITVAPLEKGFGHTLGNALRRILLNSIESPTILGFMMEGISHEYSAIKGIKEDVINIILNLKQARIMRTPNPERGRADIIVKHVLTVTEEDIAAGSGEFPVTLAMLLSSESTLELINPDLILCILTAPTTRQVQIRIGYGRGYVASEEVAIAHPREGEIILDALFSPIRTVSYVVENHRVGGATDFDKLVMNIESDGRITPREAIVFSSQIAQQHFEVFSHITDAKIQYEDEFEVEESEQDALLKKLSKRINEIELSVRSTNCLSQANVETLAQLVLMPESDMLQFRNFGKKSLNEIKDKLDDMGLHLGMDLSSYGITRDNVHELIRKYKETKQG